ncbi:hypothetical protein EJ04DRAFT_559938 [Polyplosphaeria fusca]|uniref:Uncharacterized protein n=1 Tax=Polyplosphaeria fusca TaxID=682080 RepID=A0A9P4R6S1_9PLEO|nr:hypothetical protein EJ04DRAFT_559938 [Polyplosphaeria fusca]
MSQEESHDRKAKGNANEHSDLSASGTPEIFQLGEGNNSKRHHLEVPPSSNQVTEAGTTKRSESPTGDGDATGLSPTQSSPSATLQQKSSPNISTSFLETDEDGVEHSFVSGTDEDNVEHSFISGTNEDSFVTRADQDDVGDSFLSGTHEDDVEDSFVGGTSEIELLNASDVTNIDLSHIHDNSEQEDIEKPINVSSPVTLPIRSRDLDALLQRECDPTPEEVDDLNRRRLELEHELATEFAESEQRELNCTVGPSLQDIQDRTDSAFIAPGVVVVDPDELDNIIATDTAKYSADASSIALPPSPASTSQIPSPVSNQPVTPAPTEVSNPRPRSSQKRVSFSSPTATIIETPLRKQALIPRAPVSAIKTLPADAIDHVKKPENKENTPMKPRRNASLPDEIEKLRMAVEDLAINSGMGNSIGDISTSSTQSFKMAKMEREETLTSETNIEDSTTRNSRISDAEGVSEIDSGESCPGTDLEEQLALDVADSLECLEYEFNIPGHYVHAFKINFKASSNTTSAMIADYVHQRAEELDADPKAITQLLELFYDNPARFAVRESEKGTIMDDSQHGHAENQATTTEIAREVEHPIFVIVIGLLPMAMASAIIQLVAHYGAKTLNAVMEKLTRLKLGNFQKEKE